MAFIDIDLYNWISNNWSLKTNYRENSTTGTPTDKPSAKFLIHNSTSDKKIYTWNGAVWTEGLGGGGGFNTSIKSDNFIAEKNNIYLVDTSATSITVSTSKTTDLAIGDTFYIYDYNNNSTSKNIIIDFVSQNQKIENGDNYIIDYSSCYVQLIYRGNGIWKDIPYGIIGGGGGSSSGGSGIVQQIYEEDIVTGTPVQFGTNGVKKLTTTITGTGTDIASTGVTFTDTTGIDMAEFNSVILNDGVSVITTGEFQKAGIFGGIRYGVLNPNSSEGVTWYDLVSVRTDQTAGNILPYAIVPIFTNGFIVLYPYFNTVTTTYIGGTANYICATYFEINSTTKKIIRGNTSSVGFGTSYSLTDGSACNIKGYDNAVFTSVTYLASSTYFKSEIVVKVDTSTKALTMITRMDVNTGITTSNIVNAILNSRTNSSASAKNGEILCSEFQGNSSNVVASICQYWYDGSTLSGKYVLNFQLLNKFPNIRIYPCSDGKYMAIYTNNDGNLQATRIITNTTSFTVAIDDYSVSIPKSTWYISSTNTKPFLEIVPLKNDNCFIACINQSGNYEFAILNYASKTLLIPSIITDFVTEGSPSQSYTRTHQILINKDTGYGLFVRVDKSFTTWGKCQTKKIQMGDSTSVNWIATCGIATDTVSSGLKGNVAMNGGVVTLSGLIKGAYYFINPNTGALTTTVSPCMIGKAISNTELLIVNDVTISGTSLNPTVVNSSISNGTYQQRNSVDTYGNRIEFTVSGISCGFIDADGRLILTKVPTTDPLIKGCLWSNNNILQISNG